ncbi:MAG: 4-phosphopantetheinyl transferase family protein [Flavobacterium sp.]|nr:MAG: 4-phosphopantetheinyl transferase family protein [Flavobacterium sp.]
MIGNDVIDLLAAKTESNWRRKGWLEKQFTPKEITLIFGNRNPDLMVWKLWSMKESAYKCWNRISKIRSFNPLKFECSDLSLQRGTISFGETKFYSKTTLFKNHLHTVAVSDEKALRFATEVEIQSITMENGLPYHDGKPASKSGHGQFLKGVALLDSQPGF